MKLLPDFPSLSAKIDLRAKAAILRKVVLEMQTAGSKAANLIQGEKLIKLIEKYADRVALSASPQSCQSLG